MTLKPDPPTLQPATTTEPSPKDLRPEVNATPKETQRMQERVATIVTEILELEPGFRLMPDQRLDELGLDSLMSIELAEVIGEQLGIVLSPTFAMSHPTVSLMAELLLTEAKTESEP